MNVIRDILAPTVAAPQSVPLPDPEDLALLCNFKEKEIHKIFERFCSLVNKDTGLIEKYICVQQAELSLNPLVPLAFDLELNNQIQDLDAGIMLDPSAMKPESLIKSKKGLDFFHFLMMLSKFSHKESRQAKRQCKCGLSIRFSFIFLDFFQIIVQDRKVDKMTYEHFSRFMMHISYGAVTPYVMEKVIQEMWTAVCGPNKAAVLTPQHMSHLISVIDIHQYLTINF